MREGSLVRLFPVLLAGLAAGACCGRERAFPSKDLPGLEWIFIEGGTFRMGSPAGVGSSFEHPRHRRVVGDFEVLKTEVTAAQYEACVAAGVCWESLDADPRLSNLGKPQRSNHPVNFVDWYQATTFCAWLGGRLPTEAEWEYAARSRGKDIDYPWGNEPPDCSRAALDDGSGVNCGDWRGGTSPVCSRPAGNSAQGVCDLIGNVHEWTADWFYPSYDRSGFDRVPKMLNGRTNIWSHHRVLRGGGIGSDAGQGARVRVLHDPPFAYVGLGIRCAR